MNKALTIGEIARRLDWPVHRVQYAVRAERVEPAFRAGNLRVFNDSVLDQLRKRDTRQS